MAFREILDEYDSGELSAFIGSRTDKDVETALASSKINESRLAALLSPAARRYLEPMAARARKTTLARFGKTIRLYSPLYVSNDCVNSCLYCGFNRATGIPRITLSGKEIRREAEIIASTGIKSVIIVSGDNQKAFSDERLEEAVKICAEYFPMVALEVRALPEEAYRRLKNAGADGFTMFQETYVKNAYSVLHPKGPKADFYYRLGAPERAAGAGLRSIGLGALLGLEDFRTDVFFMCLHARYIAEKYWHSQVSASFPRIRASAGAFSPERPVSDSGIIQAVSAFRLFLPDGGVNISTRETPFFRDRLIHLGATTMSAGSKTEPGGYANAREEAGQFRIEDGRSVAEFVNAVKRAGYDPVMKDWDAVFRETAP